MNLATWIGKIPDRTFLDSFGDWCLGHGTLGMIVLIIATTIGVMAFAIFLLGLISAVDTTANRGRPTVTFYRDEWEPTLSHTETRTEFNAALKLPQTRTVTVVDQWTRRR